MSEQEMATAKRLTETVEAVATLPPDQRSYLMGYARGLADALKVPELADTVCDVLDDQPVK